MWPRSALGGRDIACFAVPTLMKVCDTVDARILGHDFLAEEWAGNAAVCLIRQTGAFLNRMSSPALPAGL